MFSIFLKCFLWTCYTQNVVTYAHFYQITILLTLLTSGSAITGSHSVGSNETTVTYFSKSVSHKIVSLCTIVSTIQWADHCKHFCTAINVRCKPIKTNSVGSNETTISLIFQNCIT